MKKLYAGIDENGYFDGDLIEDAEFDGSVEVSGAPPYEEWDKQRSCKWVDGEWIFDEDKYNEISAVPTDEKTVEEQIQELVEERKEIKQRLDEHEEMLFTLVDVAMGGE